MATWYSVPGAAGAGMATLTAVAVVTQPVPVHLGAGDVWAGQFTTEEEEKLGTDDVTMKCTPDPTSDVEPPDQCRLTVEPGMTAKDES
jgi:hypothetical protein